ncbi:PREDICTED: tapasin-related protein-like [Tinamus guttatus]|uniref:tapasin-related protein-like n=1 Tax=Tinamus guttatus TaxID=94827 RepID=UPI00052E80D9|nr:PREDICTED: tapasin-related protein-like [Tinamus guttatus]
MGCGALLGAGCLLCLVVFLVHTRTSAVRSALSKDVLFDCAFSTDHRAAVTIQWVLHQKGGLQRPLFTYDGSRNLVEHAADRAKMFLEEIPKGNASLLLRNVGMRDEGMYSCSVSVSSLTGQQAIQLQIEEKPTVSVNAVSLSLVEGEQHKLICDIRNYYPLGAQAQWLRELAGSRKVPDVVRNVIPSSHRESSNGTYSFSQYFLLTASLRDNGHTYTCRVEHQSLRTPIRRSVVVKVRVRSTTKDGQYKEVTPPCTKCASSQLEIGFAKPRLCFSTTP